MEEKKALKISLSTFFLILSIIVIIIMSFFLFKFYNNKPIEVEQSISKTINFNKKNCINNSNFLDSNYKIGRFGVSVEMDGLSLSINSDNEKTVDIQVRYDEMFPDQYSDEDIINNSKQYYDEIELTFDKKVESIFGGLFGPDGTQDMVYLFLLEDGSLEYMKCSDIYNSKKYEHQSISEINDIVKFDNVTLSKDVGEEHTCIYTVIAYKIDGSYYDLSNFITLN